MAVLAAVVSIDTLRMVGGAFTAAATVLIGYLTLRGKRYADAVQGFAELSTAQAADQKWLRSELGVARAELDEVRAQQDVMRQKLDASNQVRARLERRCAVLERKVAELEAKLA